MDRNHSRLPGFCTRKSIARLLLGMLMLPLVASGATASPPSSGTQGERCDLPSPQAAISSILDSLEWDVRSVRTITNVHGEPYRQVDLAVSGRLVGCTTVDSGNNDAYLTDAPDLPISNGWRATTSLRPPYQLPLTAGWVGPARLVKGMGTFRAEDGSGLDILYPEHESAWNGKLFVIQHGGGAAMYPSLAPLVAREPGSSFDPNMSSNLFAGLMIDGGYAVVWVRQDHSGRVNRVDLEDGTTVTRRFSSHAGYELALTAFSQQFVGQQLGNRPRRTYAYGHSLGGKPWRQVNYSPGTNGDSTGRLIVDGFIVDDVASGLPIPVRFDGDSDLLFDREGERAGFVPQIDITRALYDTDGSLLLKRENTRLLDSKGLGGKHRVYEIRGVSHFDRAQGPAATRRPESLDLGGIMEAMIDALDQWVDAGIDPSESRSDASFVASAPAIALPEIACPLGVYYAFPPDAENAEFGSQTTTFAAFDGASLEPIDGRGLLVDMNENGVQDRRESVEEAWRRLRVLGSEEAFTTARYAACVDTAAASLAADGLLPWRVIDHYREEAARFRLSD